MDTVTDGVVVIGAGLAGCECALALAKRGVPVKLYEMRPQASSAAHKTDHLAELVCSNSLKALRADSAAGLLKAELTRLGSTLIELAKQAAVPAGGALAVDRDVFSSLVEQAVAAEPLIELIREEVVELPQGCPVVVAAGPLCSGALAQTVEGLVGGKKLSFFDAAAPIVDASTLDREKVFAMSRYDKGDGDDYLNCPMDKEEYDRFVDELVGAERAILRDFERRELFQACQPAEEVARTGHDALRFGALKPVGIIDPRTGFPAESDVVSATVVSRTSLEGDGYSTSLILMGAEGALQFAAQHPEIDIVLVDAQGRIFATPGIGDRVPFRLLNSER